MSHEAQKEFCKWVKDNTPNFFKQKSILDVGSLDINGNNRWLFDDCRYFGVDLYKGRNVDWVGDILSFHASEQYDVVISTEMLEHDHHWEDSIEKMYALTKSKGLFVITCAGTGRPVHGTFDAMPKDSPATLLYYCNISAGMLKEVMSGLCFLTCSFSENQVSCDTYFWGIKK